MDDELQELVKKSNAFREKIVHYKGLRGDNFNPGSFTVMLAMLDAQMVSLHKVIGMALQQKYVDIVSDAAAQLVELSEYLKSLSGEQT